MKILLIETESYSEYEDPNIVVHELSTCKEVANRFVSEFARDYDVMQSLLKNEEFIKALDQNGYRNIQKIENIEEKITAGKRFYFCDEVALRYLKEIDLTKLESYYSQKLANEKTLILQNVEKSTLNKVNSSAYKSMLGAKNRIEALKKSQVERMAKKQEKKKQKEIEKAKSLLQEAGMMVK